MTNKFTPAIHRAVERIRTSPVQYAESWIPADDQAQLIYEIMLTPASRYYAQIWNNPTYGRIRAVLRQVLSGETRGTSGRTDRRELIGITNGQDVMRRVHNYIPRNVQIARREIEAIEHQIEKVEMMLTMAKKSKGKIPYTSNPVGLPFGGPNGRITATIKDKVAEDKKRKEEAAKKQQNLIARLEAQLLELGKKLQRNKKIVAPYTSDSPVFDLADIPSASDLSVERHNNQYSIVPSQSQNEAHECIEAEQRRLQHEALYEKLFDSRHEREYRWIVSHMRGEIDKRYRKQAAQTLGIPYQQYIARLREVKEFFRCHHAELQAMTDMQFKEKENAYA